MVATVEQLPPFPLPLLHTPHWLNDFAVGVAVAVAVDVDVGHSRFVVKLVLQIFCVHLFGGSNRNKAVGGGGRQVGRSALTCLQRA